MKIERVPIDTLTLDPSNARKHSEKNLDAIKGSLNKFGQVKPIVVKDNVIIAGNGTWAAAKKLNFETIDIVRVDHMSQVEAAAFALADNKTAELAEWDDDVLNKTLDALLNEGFEVEDIGFDIDDLPNIGGSGNTDEDAVPDVEQNTYGVKIGDIWQLGSHRILCGDSTVKENVDRLMDGRKADMVFTDPPYNVNYGGHNNQERPQKHKLIENDHMSGEDFLEFCNKWMSNLSAITDGCLYIFGPPGPDGRIMFSVADEKYHCSTTVVWKKDRLVLGRGKYHNIYEPCWFGWIKSGNAFVKDRSLVNVWDVKRPSSSDLHPTMKPIELIEIAINHASNKSVADIFLGSGSTLIACEKTGRTCYGMEIDPHYCSVIIKRWEDYTGKKAERVEHA